MKTIFRHIKDNVAHFAVNFAAALTGSFIADFIKGEIQIFKNVCVAIVVAAVVTGVCVAIRDRVV